MAIIETSRPVPFGAVTTFRVVNFFDKMRNAVVQYRSARATEKALRGLSDAQLQDIGLHRSQIASVARNPGYYN